LKIWEDIKRKETRREEGFDKMRASTGFPAQLAASPTATRGHAAARSARTRHDAMAVASVVTLATIAGLCHRSSASALLFPAFFYGGWMMGTRKQQVTIGKRKEAMKWRPRNPELARHPQCPHPASSRRPWHYNTASV
jgi:hypothetical protein